jgi:hypothetical protein
MRKIQGKEILSVRGTQFALKALMALFIESRDPAFIGLTKRSESGSFIDEDVFPKPAYKPKSTFFLSPLR